MSHEFEEVVLEKLNNFEGKFDKIEKTLDEHTAEFKKVNKVLDEHTAEFEKVNKTLDKHTKDIENLREITMSNKASLIKLERTVNDIESTTRLYGNMLIEHEYDLNLKFDTLMDAFSLNKEKHAEYDDLLLHYNQKCIDHDLRIFKLENDMKKFKIA